MVAYIITVGDELLIGQVINTNAAFIGNELTKNQIKVFKTSVVGDNKVDILKEFSEAWSAAVDIIIVTGGLGPTHDDLTRDCIVEFFNSKLVLDEEILQDIKDLFAKRGREMSKVNETQAYVPKIANVIRNTRGTAPGIWIKKDEKIFVSMPGVPHEMHEMMNSYVIPNLVSLKGKSEKIIKMKNLLTTGIPESNLYEKLGNLDELLLGARLAFLPNQFGVKMRVTVEGDSDEDASNKLFEIEQKIRNSVGRFIYGTEDEALEDVVGRLLKDRGLTVAVAESCTGGLISHRLTNISGSSDYYERGFITYSNGAKVEHLKVNEDTLAQKGAVSIEVAMQMADGVRAVSGTDIGLSITGILGPTGATANKPVGLVFVGICDEKVCYAKRFQFGDDRLINKDRASQAALELLRRHILGIPYEE